MSTQNSQVALAIIDFLKDSVAKGAVALDFAESLDVAIECIADAFEVDKDAKYGGKSLAQLVSADTVPVNIPEEDQEVKAKAELLKLEGNRAMARKDYNEAIAKYTELLELIPSNAVYLSNRAALYSSNKQHEKAVADAELSIKNDPTFARGYSRLGLLKFALGDAKAAMEAYKAGLDAEGDKPSDSMKKGYEIAKARVQSELESSLESTKEPATRSGADSGSASGAGSGAGGAGGLPDLSNLASMLGGGGAGGMADLFNNPQIMKAAESMMSNPSAMLEMMNNPAIKQMASQFGLGGGAGAGSGADSTAGSSSGSSAAQPSLSDLMNNPELADMAKQFLSKWK